MTSNSRYTVAIHILTLLAFCGPEAQTSEFIAGSVNTNPVVIRRLLASLREARLVASQGGPGGGWRLLREPGAISLGQIFRAVEGSALFPLHAAEPNPCCPVGKHIQEALAGIFQGALAALEGNLDQTSLADLVSAVQGRTS